MFRSLLNEGRPEREPAAPESVPAMQYSGAGQRTLTGQDGVALFRCNGQGSVFPEKTKKRWLGPCARTIVLSNLPWLLQCSARAVSLARSPRDLLRVARSQGGRNGRRRIRLIDDIIHQLIHLASRRPRKQPTQRHLLRA